MKRTPSMLLVAMLLLAMWVPSWAATDTIEVTTQPLGAVYQVGEEAAPLQAVFAFNLESQAQFDEASLEWFVSASGSTDDRSYGFGDADAEWTNDMTFETSLKPDTSSVGVRYYYAVLTYREYQLAVGFSEPSNVVYKEAVCIPARIEVVAPRQLQFDITVYKTDEEGNPLSGAVLMLQPDENYGAGYNLPTYRDVTQNGVARFLVPAGYYILSEEEAPEGYELSGETYRIVATENGLMLDYHSQDMRPYQPVTFINSKIPVPDVPEPEPPPEEIPAEPPLVGITVMTNDENGNPLSDVVLTLKPDPAYPLDGDLPSYEGTSVDGKVEFRVEPGHYILSEEKAPTGYILGFETYTITVTLEGVSLPSGSPSGPPDATMTLVNYKIPALNKEDHFAFMAGYPDGRFGPEQNMTRAEAVVMFARLLVKGMGPAENHRNGFYPDVSAAAWYANEVGYMQSLGVLVAYSRGGDFRPGDYVTRAEFATLAAHFDDLDLVDTNAFSDVASTHWAVRYINSAAAKGWISGYGDGTFKPEAHITRAEVVALVGRMLGRSADAAYLKANVSALPRVYTDIEASHWAYLSVMEASTGHNYIADSLGEHWTAVY